MNSPSPSAASTANLTRRIGFFDATTAVVGGIVGAGIFMNPSVVAKAVGSPLWIAIAWILGGAVALSGAWIYAELGSERPAPGGQYAYFREAYHPGIAFLYGWGLLWVIQSGGMAAVAVTFAQYLGPLIGWKWEPRLIAVGALMLLTAINCFGVRAGASTQSLFTVLKGVAIAGLIACGLFLARSSGAPVHDVAGGSSAGLPSLGSAMVPVLFAYGGWQTACFLAGEIREPKRNLPRALVVGIGAVILLYLATNLACLQVLGVGGLAATSTPASDVMRLTLGEGGATLIAIGIAISTFGFLSQGMLTTPRVYYAMARDDLFFSVLGRVNPRSGSPVPAICLQGVVASVIAWWGEYAKILDYVVSVDFIFYGLAGVCVFVFRRRDGRAPAFRVPGHPWTTLFFIVVCWGVVLNLVREQPANSLKGLGILALGIPAYFAFRWVKQRRDS